MIPKGNQRAGGQQLATHLLNAYDNDRIEVAEVRGAIAQDLHGAFAEWYAQAKTTDCQKYLYSLSINPDYRQGQFTREHYYDFIRRTEKKLGLASQPRAVVFHVKYGREHCHVVWSRIDAAEMKAVQLSHDRQKLRSVAQQYAKDHNLTLPPGMRNDRGKARFAFRAAAENLGEKQQQERSGISKQERREQITKFWKDSSDGRSFVRALESGGFLLARGDRRAYVVVDLSGEIHSLSRQLVGVKAKELKSRLANYEVERLPDAATAQHYARDKRQALLEQNEKQERVERKVSPSERAAQAKTEDRSRRDELAKAHTARRADLEAKKQQLAKRHDAERGALTDLQGSRNAEVARQRAVRQPKGVIALLARVTGYDAFTTYRQKKHDRQLGLEFKAQKDALDRRHGREMEDFKHRERGLTSLEKRERRSLETSLRSEAFRRIAAPQKEKPRAPELTKEQQGKVAALKQAAAEITAPAKTEKREQEVGTGGSKVPILTPAFTAAAKTIPVPPALTAKFNEMAAAAKTAAPPQRPVPETSTEARAREFRETAASLTPAQRRALELSKAFNQRAGSGRQRDHDEKTRDRSKHYRRTPPDLSFRR